MFTGIIEELGRVRDIERRGEDARIVIEARAVTEGSRDGDSISVNGVCLTALAVTPDSFAADVSKETLFRSTLGNLKARSPINLERAVTPETRLGGHIVQGHVDGRGRFLSSESHGDSWTFRFGYPKAIACYLVLKGSVAVEGVSLTIANLTDDYFEIAVIPKTLELTNFSQLKPGDEVNLEADVIAKHIERILSVPSAESDVPAQDDRSPSALRAVLSLGIIVAIIGVNWYLFRLFQANYFVWYLQKAPLISIAAGFLVPVIASMRASLGMVSTNPAVYAGASLQVGGVFVTSISTWTSAAPERLKRSSLHLGLTSAFGRAFDNVMYTLLMLVLAVLTVGWLVTVAPLSYFVTLIAGVPARESLRGKILRTSISERDGGVAFGGDTKVSFVKDPFAITQGVSALLLFIAGLIYFRFA